MRDEVNLCVQLVYVCVVMCVCMWVGGVRGKKGEGGVSCEVKQISE
jgi:hypothetical protein